MNRWYKLIISIGCLVVIFFTASLKDVKGFLQATDLQIFFAGVGIFILAIFVFCAGWGLLVRGYGLRQGLASLLSLAFLGAFLNILVPDALFGDRLRGYALGSRTGDLVRSWAATMLERFVSLISIFGFTLLLMGFGGTLLNGISVQLPILLLGIMFIGIPVVFFIFLFEVKKWLGRDWFTEIMLCSVLLPNRRKIFFESLLYGPMIIFIEGMGIWIISISMGIDVPNLVYFILAGLLYLLRLFPVSYALFGIQDLIFVFTMPYMGLSIAQSFAFSIMIHVARILSTFPGLFFMKVMSEKLVRPSQNQVGEPEM
ncbi:MAG: flippase-like domain-containing protein [Candidatus Eremiobacteraeota bacterium]|nr:flippase-like domain-containing protein [Candidatus Eremiobacteraeota bacterium]